MWSRSETKIIEVLFIRHGATAGNLEHRYIGRTDEPLCPAGRERLLQGGYYAKYDPEKVFSSPMTRCRQTAKLLYPAQSAEIIGEWSEMDFGQFEGKNYRELDKNPAYQAWIDSNGTLPFPGGESREMFEARSFAGMERMMRLLWQEPFAGDGGSTQKKAACIVHGGTIMAILSRDTGEDYFSFSCKNGEGYHCIYESCGEKRRLLSWEKKGI